MSAEIVATPVVNAEEKVKKPTFLAKYSKFMNFGFYFVSQMKETGVLDDALFDTLCGHLHLSSSVEDQIDYYKSFLDVSKDAAKALRKDISARRKAAKNANKPPRKPRNNNNNNKNKKNDHNDLINELVSLSSGEPTVPPDAPSLNDKPKKLRKPRAKKGDSAELPSATVKEVLAVETVSNNAPADADIPTDEAGTALPPTPPVKEEKPKKERKPKAKKEKTVVVADPVPSPTPVVATQVAENKEEDDEELDVREFVLNEVQYWIDDSTGNVFDYETQEHVGNYNADTKTFIKM
jgi:hypothetical protein